MTDTAQLEPGDIFFTKGTGLLSRAIRFFTRGIGEKRTRVNHVGVIVSPGDFETCVAVEALVKVREHSVWSRYGPPIKDLVAAYRRKELSGEQRSTIVAEAKEQVGKEYGVGKVVAHFLDWCLLGAYVFRRLANNGRYPICSWLVAHAFDKAGVRFGVPPEKADPDHIWDAVTDHNQEEYEEIYPLQSIWATDD